MKTFKPPFDVVLTKGAVLRRITIFDFEGNSLVEKVTSDNEVAKEFYDDFSYVVTAVNAYPALVAENAELKNRIKAIDTLVRANIFNGNELLLCVSDGRGRHCLAKEILSILPAVEGVKK